jgi:hypothetical protein
MLVKCSTKLYFSLYPAEGITHCEDAPPAEGPNEEELPEPSSVGVGAAAAALRNAATLGFLPVRPMPPLSRGIKEQLQADRQHVRHRSGRRSGPQSRT